MDEPKAITMLGWDRPALASAADELIDRYRVADRLAMGQVVLVTPGRRAGRRLLEVLVDRCRQEQLTLVPPRFITVGKLPDLLQPYSRPQADRMARRLAWVDAMQAIKPEALARLLPSPPTDDDLAGWLMPAEELDALHIELAGEMLDFSAAARRADQADLFSPAEAHRWRTLTQIQQIYLRRLEELGLADPQMARIDAIDAHTCTTENDIVLLAVADMPAAVRRMLEQVAGRVSVMVFAPPEPAEAFDSWGCIRVDYWRAAKVNLPDDSIEVADRPADQAQSALRTIAAMQGRCSADEITIGVADENILPHLQQHFAEAGIAVHSAAGLSAGRTRPLTLLSAAADFLQSRSFEDFGSLVRHIDVESELARRLETDGRIGDWLESMDRYYSEHLQGRADGKWLGNDAKRSKLSAVYSQVLEILGELTDRRPRPIGEWAQPILQLLLNVFGHDELDLNRPDQRLIVESCEAITRLLKEFHGLDGKSARTSAVTAIEILIRDAAKESIPLKPDPAAVELLGWLELSLDDAANLIVTGFNEPAVPASLNEHMFLPNRLRKALGILDNDRRYARDAYALTAILQSRERVTLIVGRRSPQNDPLKPSRLLFACDDDQVARRVLRFAAEADEARRPHRIAVRQAASASAFVVPSATQPYEKDSIRVTAFRDYIASPYGFYLKHVLKLQCLDDSAVELDAMAFGSLAHDVLNNFGSDQDARQLQKADDIAAFLREELGRIAGRRFGDNPPPAVQVQLDQLRGRLDALARWQAEWAGQGWQIHDVEVDFSDQRTKLQIPGGEEMILHGRIDRIDVHQDGRYAIFDYKTGESVKEPEKTHRRRGEWKDLQLPLYRHLARAHGIEDVAVLGYIALPRELDKVGFLPAQWSPEDFAEADQCACEIIMRIRAGDFGDIGDSPPRDEILQAICGLDVLVTDPTGDEGDNS